MRNLLKHFLVSCALLLALLGIGTGAQTIRHWQRAQQKILQIQLEASPAPNLRRPLKARREYHAIRSKAGRGLLRRRGRVLVASATPKTKVYAPTSSPQYTPPLVNQLASQLDVGGFLTTSVLPSRSGEEDVSDMNTVSGLAEIEAGRIDEGMATWSRATNVGPGDQYAPAVSQEMHLAGFDSATKGTLALISSDQGFSVWVDGNPQEVTTPCLLVLESGSHQIEVSTSDGSKLEFDVFVLHGRRNEVAVDSRAGSVMVDPQSAVCISGVVPMVKNEHRTISISLQAESDLYVQAVGGGDARVQWYLSEKPQDYSHPINGSAPTRVRFSHLWNGYFTVWCVEGSGPVTRYVGFNLRPNAYQGLSAMKAPHPQ